MGLNQDEFTNIIYLLAYDVPSENLKGISKDRKESLVKLRNKIYYALKHKYKCYLVQNSLWRLHDTSILNTLEEKIQEWKDAYESMGYEAKIEIIKIGVDDKGKETFDDLEAMLILEWLGSIQESIMRRQNEKEITKTWFNQILRKLDLATEIVNDLVDSPRYNECMDTISLLYDLVHSLANQLKDKDGENNGESQ